MTDKNPPSADDIPAIIFAEWKRGKTVKEIARQMGLDLATVMRSLKRTQRNNLPNDDR